MKTYLFLFFSVIFAMLIVSCSNSGSSTLNEDSLLKQGAYYFFQMSDENNQPIAEGRMKIVYKKNLIISGIYELTKIYNDSVPGLNTMKDTFSGKESKDDNAVYLNMNPKVSDNNVIFEFNVSNNKIRGKWYFTTLLGIKAGGILTGSEIEN